jgi:acetyl-CoA C-acetyltransferase/acetyl-CoA acyltransferase
MVMGDTAEVVAKRYKVSREAQDEYALASQQRTARAQAEGRLAAEIAPLRVTRGVLDKQTGAVVGKEDVLFDTDECNRPDTTIEGLAKLKPVRGEGNFITAGNASQLSDGAAAVVLMTAGEAEKRGLRPLARIVASASAGVDPREMGMGPVPATRKALARAGLAVKDLDLVELNEAFAAQALAVIQELGLDHDRVDVDGGAIAIGHPLGMSGARLMTHLVHALRARGGRYGLATLCVGVGQGLSVVIESVAS